MTGLRFGSSLSAGDRRFDKLTHENMFIAGSSAEH